MYVITMKNMNKEYFDNFINDVREALKAVAEKYGVELLGQIPIVQSIRECGDSGEPAALSSGPDGVAFLQLAEKLLQVVG